MLKCFQYYSINSTRWPVASNYWRCGLSDKTPVYMGSSLPLPYQPIAWEIRNPVENWEHIKTEMIMTF